MPVTFGGGKTITKVSLVVDASGVKIPVSSQTAFQRA
jgi:hypothetical protein